jgi:tRNA threonylcarbamoyladenosine biosynthesis protein TsaE
VICLRSRSSEDTYDIAGALAPLVEAGDVILLSGDLGAGKTIFVKGLAHGLGVEEPVTSPTFTLVHTYNGRLPVLHADLYRLPTVQEVIDLSLPELMDDDGSIAVVEWGEAALGVFGGGHLAVRIDHDLDHPDLDHPDDDDCARRLGVQTVGSKWAKRAAGLTAALAPWSDPAPGGT